MKLMSGVTKWAVTIHGSGDSQGWAVFYASKALTQCLQERQSKKKGGGFFFFNVRQRANRERDIRWQEKAYSKRKGWGREEGVNADGREGER